MLRFALTFASLAVVLLAPAEAFSEDRWTGLRPLVGRPEAVTTLEGDTLLDVAFRERMGFDPVIRLNPEVAVWIPEPGTLVELPTVAVLPTAEERGLVINVPEMRMYDFTVGPEPRVISVAIGDPDDPTLLGSYRVGGKRVHPTWNVPASIRAERPELPAAVSPGPHNPLGSRWMTVGSTTYGIHGTNNRWSIGRTATHGCIRLYEDVMEDLFDRIPEGTPITLVYEPIKIGRRDGHVYVEVHPDIYERLLGADLGAYTLARLDAMGLGPSVDRDAVVAAVREAIGYPVRIGTLPDAPAAPTVEAAPSEYVVFPR